MVQPQANQPRPTSNHINSGKNSSAPVVDRTKTEKTGFTGERPECDHLSHGEHKLSEHAVEVANRDKQSTNIDLSASSSNPNDVPAPPADVKGGMRK